MDCTLKTVLTSPLRGALIAAAVCALAALAEAQERAATHVVPFFPAASNIRPDGFVRVVNNSGEAGTITIVAVDDAGSESDALTLEIGANETASLDAGALEAGDPDRGLTGSTGAGQGDWRLWLTSELDIELQAFARTPDGALWEMHETALLASGSYRIATFNPGSNLNQVSRLRLVNPGDEPAAVTIRGTDDSGASPSPGVMLEILPGEAQTFTAAELESGVAVGLEGSLGDGEGKWRLDVESTIPIRVMSLLSSPTGHLTNLSTLPARESGGIHRVPLFPPVSDPFGRQGFARVVNRSDAAGEVHIEAFDETSWTYDPLTLAVDARQTRHFNSQDLELGSEDKGLTGSTGAGEGNWRLELTSDLDIEVLSYVRTVGGQGYVTPMHDTASRESGGLMRYYVPVFHPADYEGQGSRLHLVNFGSSDAQVGISGLDDAGQPPSEGDVSLVLAGGATRVLTAEQLDNGDSGLDGRFGTGSGSWRLFVTAEGRLQVMSLGYSTEGFLANLSRGLPPAAETARSRPDLAVEAPSVSDSTPDAGAEFRLSATVTNRGEGDADATGLHFYRSDNAHISATDIEIGSSRVEPLSAGGSSGKSLAVAAPPQPGTYYFGACVDAVDGESDTANNCSSSVAVTVPEPPGTPDLVVLSPSVSNSRVRVGEAFTVSVTVRNSGEAAAASTTLRYYRSIDATVSSADTPVGTDAVIALGASGSSGESITLNAPGDAGTHYYGACVDAVEGESNTANNCSPAITVTVTRARPDLLVQPPTVSNSSPDAGDPFTLSVTVRNGGDGDAIATTLRYYRSVDTDITDADTPVGSDAVAGLTVQDGSNESITLNAPTDAGTYYYGACVDAVTDESDTANNCSSAVAVTVPVATAGNPDLIVGSPSVSEDRPAPGATFVLSATVRNVGSVDAVATTLHYYRSTDTTITKADTSEGTDAVAPLAAAGSGSHSVTLEAPSTAGT